MSAESRLAEVLDALEGVGLTCLVLGGHAVRYYGLDRNTNDFDLHIAPGCWDDLAERLARTSLFAGGPVVEGPTWRPGSFRRFQIGTLESGREEWLEFWRENHLLGPFEDLHARREMGLYGARMVPFLALPDLIRSKETERESDWQDVFYLEEVLDARLLAKASSGGEAQRLDALAGVRSRRGYERLLQQGLLNDPAVVRSALGQTTLSITHAYLIPSVPRDESVAPASVSIEPVVFARLRAEPPGSSLHLTLVELVRRQYKLARQDADRADKQAVRAAIAGQEHDGTVE